MELCRISPSPPPNKKKLLGMCKPFSLVQWARDQASRLPAKSLKKQTKTYAGRASKILEQPLPRASWNSLQVFFQVLVFFF